MRDERAELIMKEHDIQPPAVGSVTLKSVHLDPHAATYQARSQSDRLNEEMRLPAAHQVDEAHRPAGVAGQG